MYTQRLKCSCFAGQYSIIPKKTIGHDHKGKNWRPWVRTNQEATKVWSSLVDDWKVIINGLITLLIVFLSGLTQVAPTTSGITSPVISSYKVRRALHLEYSGSLRVKGWRRATKARERLPAGCLARQMDKGGPPDQ